MSPVMPAPTKVRLPFSSTPAKAKLTPADAVAATSTAGPIVPWTTGVPVVGETDTATEPLAEMPARAPALMVTGTGPTQTRVLPPTSVLKRGPVANEALPVNDLSQLASVTPASLSEP